MFYRELFSKRDTNGDVDYSKEIKFVRGLAPIALQHDSEVVEKILYKLRGMDMFGGQVFNATTWSAMAMPIDVDVILSIQENLVCYSGLSMDGRIVIPDDIYGDWLCVLHSGLRRTVSPITRCLNFIAPVVKGLNTDYRRVAIECVFSDNTELIGAPVSSNRVRIGTVSMLSKLRSQFPSSITIDDNEFEKLNAGLYNAFRSKEKSAPSVEFTISEDRLCKVCKAPLGPKGNCPFCSAMGG